MMQFNNSNFIQSTIRNDDGIKGAIFVDSILLRESELQYGDETNKIPLQEIVNKDFLNALQGLLVFDEHPDKMLDSENYNALARESVGSIVNAEYRELNGDNVVYGTLRITNPKMIEEVKTRQVRGGSLGYYAGVDETNTQRNLKPNHFCLTRYPRDEGVVIFNSNKKGENMELKENEIIVSKSMLNSFIGQIGEKIVDVKVKSILNSKSSDLDKLSFLDSVLSIKDIFNSEEVKKDEPVATKEVENSKEVEDLKAKLADLEKKNSELAEALAKKNEADEKADEAKKEEKTNEADEESKENSECGDSDGKKDEPKENEADEKEKENEADKEVENSAVPVGAKAVTNSAEGNHFRSFISQF